MLHSHVLHDRTKCALVSLIAYVGSLIEKAYAVMCLSRTARTQRSCIARNVDLALQPCVVSRHSQDVAVVLLTANVSYCHAAETNAHPKLTAQRTQPTSASTLFAYQTEDVNTAKRLATMVLLAQSRAATQSLVNAITQSPLLLMQCALMESHVLVTVALVPVASTQLSMTDVTMEKRALMIFAISTLVAPTYQTQSHVLMVHVSSMLTVMMELNAPRTNALTSNATIPKRLDALQDASQRNAAASTHYVPLIANVLISPPVARLVDAKQFAEPVLLMRIQHAEPNVLTVMNLLMLLALYWHLSHKTAINPFALLTEVVNTTLLKVMDVLSLAHQLQPHQLLLLRRNAKVTLIAQ